MTSLVLREDRTLIAITMTQLLADVLTTPEWVVLVVDDAVRCWADHQLSSLTGDRAAVERQRLWEVRAKTGAAPVPVPVHFADHYSVQVEGQEGLPDETRAAIWLDHVKTLAPAGHPVHRCSRDLATDATGRLVDDLARRIFGQ